MPEDSGARIVVLMALHLTASDQRWQSAVKLTEWTSREDLVSPIFCVVLNGANTQLIPNHDQMRSLDGRVLPFVLRPTPFVQIYAQRTRYVKYTGATQSS